MSNTHAIIETGGKQYLVKAGSRVRVESLPSEAGSTTSFVDKISGTTVAATIIDHGKHETVRVVKFHNKTRSYRRRGHRQAFTTLRIDAIA